jgi:hypothetical protein
MGILRPQHSQSYCMISVNISVLVKYVSCLQHDIFMDYRWKRELQRV